MPMGSHLSSRILIDFLSPTDQRTLVIMASLPLKRFCQPQDGREPLTALKKDEEWKYKPLKNLPHKDKGC